MHNTAEERKLPYKWRKWIDRAVYGGYSSREIAIYYANREQSRTPSEEDFIGLYVLDCAVYAHSCKNEKRGYFDHPAGDFY